MVRKQSDCIKPTHVNEFQCKKIRFKVAEEKTMSYKACILVVILSHILMLAVPYYFNQNISSFISNSSSVTDETFRKQPIYQLYGKHIESGYLKHVKAVLKRLGFQESTRNTSDWDLLWAHDYPFRAMQPLLRNLNYHQKVNHFPGSGYITSKVELATSTLKYVPPAFKMPGDKEKFLQYAKLNPNATFIQKNNNHRGISVKKYDEMDFVNSESFIQEYIANPLLVDGHKFDIGVYTILTSINPLRVYIYNGDILFRFCPEKYYPFQSDEPDKYIVGDDYLPFWEVSALKTYYNNLGYSMKDSFDAYIKSTGRNYKKIWEQVEEAIRNLYLQKEPLLSKASGHYRSTFNFFEMVRIDFVIDDNLNVYLLEANMSPNLSSAHFPPNRLLYEQVLFNTFSLVGIGRHIKSESLEVRDQDEINMQVSMKNIVVFPEICSSYKCATCDSLECLLCQPCLTDKMETDFIMAYLEHVNRLECKRVFPPLMDRKNFSILAIDETYSLENKLMIHWFWGKCLLDELWCK